MVAACAYWQWWFWGPGELLRVLCPPVSSVRRVLSCPGLRFWSIWILEPVALFLTIVTVSESCAPSPLLAPLAMPQTATLPPWLRHAIATYGDADLRLAETRAALLCPRAL